MADPRQSSDARKWAAVAHVMRSIEGKEGILALVEELAAEEMKTLIATNDPVALASARGGYRALRHLRNQLEVAEVRDQRLRAGHAQKGAPEGD